MESLSGVIIHVKRNDITEGGDPEHGFCMENRSRRPRAEAVTLDGGVAGTQSWGCGLGWWLQGEMGEGLRHEILSGLYEI